MSKKNKLSEEISQILKDLEIEEKQIQKSSKEVQKKYYLRRLHDYCRMFSGFSVIGIVILCIIIVINAIIKKSLNPVLLIMLLPFFSFLASVKVAENKSKTKWIYPISYYLIANLSVFFLKSTQCFQSMKTLYFLAILFVATLVVDYIYLIAFHIRIKRINEI